MNGAVVDAAHRHGSGHAHIMSALQQEVLWWTILGYLVLFALGIAAMRWHAKPSARKGPAARRPGKKRPRPARRR